MQRDLIDLHKWNEQSSWLLSWLNLEYQTTFLRLPVPTPSAPGPTALASPSRSSSLVMTRIMTENFRLFIYELNKCCRKIKASLSQPFQNKRLWLGRLESCGHPCTNLYDKEDTYTSTSISQYVSCPPPSWRMGQPHENARTEVRGAWLGVTWLEGRVKPEAVKTRVV